MQTKSHMKIQDKTIASIVALGVITLAILFVAFILPALPNIMERFQQRVTPMGGMQIFDIGK